MGLITLINIWGVPPGSTTPRALRFCSGRPGYVTSPTDTPANTVWRPGLQYPFHMKRELFGSKDAGSSRTNSGDVVVVAKDARLDPYDYLDWGFDGQKVECFVGYEDQPFTTFVQAMRGVTETAELTWEKFTFSIKDRQQELEIPIPILPKYLGTNSGSTGVEGGADDLQGKFKPCCLGPCADVTPLWANSSAKVGQVHFRSVQAITAVYSNGLPMTFAADYATPTALAEASIANGSFATCLAYGLFRVNTTNGTVITADVQGDNVGGYVSDGAGILRRLMEMAGWAADVDFSTADLMAIGAKNGAAQGIYDTQGSKVRDLMDQVCAGPWFWFCPDRFGVMRFGRIEPPGSSPVRLFTDSHILDLERVVNDLSGPPWSLVTMNCEKNWTVMRATEIAAAVPDDRRAWLLLDTRSCPHTSDGNPDPAVLARHPLAEQVLFNGLFSARADGLAEAQRRGAFRAATRRGFTFQVSWLDYGRVLDLGQTCALTSRRFGLSALPVTITAIEDITEKNIAEVTVCA